MSPLETLFVWTVVLGVPALLVGVPVVLLCGGIRNFGLSALAKRYRGLTLRSQPRPGDVQVVYHTYRGFLVYVVQDEHVLCGSPAEVRRMLGRLLRFNLTWGLLSLGCVLVPLIATANYAAQRRALREQRETAAV